MSFYPLNLKITGRECLVLGGGEVAERKIHALVTAGARVTVCSPGLTSKLRELAEHGRICHQEAAYRPGAIGNFFIVICATDDAVVNRQAAEEAQGRGALVNVVDSPEVGDFIVPAQISRGDLMITISTNGKSPVLARRLREELEELYGPEYGLYLEMVSRLRAQLKGACGTVAARRSFWRETVNAEILALLKAGRLEEAEEKIKDAASGTGTKS